MQMLEPDFWKGRGRYSKQAMSRKVVDTLPARSPDKPSTEEPQG